MTPTRSSELPGKVRPAKVRSPNQSSQPFWPARKNATSTTQPSVAGMRNFQPKRMNWS